MAQNPESQSVWRDVDAAANVAIELKRLPNGFLLKPGTKCAEHYMEKPMDSIQPEECADFCASQVIGELCDCHSVTLNSQLDCEAFTQFKDKDGMYHGCFLYSSSDNCADDMRNWISGFKGDPSFRMHCRHFA